MSSTSVAAGRPPFDAVLIISHGGPQGRDDIRPFVSNVLRGRPLAPSRIEEVVRQYELFDGKSPLTELTCRQAQGLHDGLRRRGLDVPVRVGMLHWHPLLTDTLHDMAQAGVRRAVGFIATPHHCYSSCQQYKEDVVQARQALRQGGYPDVEVTYVESWYDHPGFIAAHARHIGEALARLAPSVRGEARIVFTAHSIPIRMARTCRYEEQVRTSARLAAEQLKRDDWTVVYQGRSGRRGEPWLGPDVGDYLRAEQARGLKAVGISPIGFVCDHVEVRYELDHVVAGLCRELGLAMVRAETVNADPVFVDMMVDVVLRTWDRYRRFPPVPLCPQGLTAGRERSGDGGGGSTEA